jgi:hypothetical protein
MYAIAFKNHSWCMCMSCVQQQSATNQQRSTACLSCALNRYALQQITLSVRPISRLLKLKGHSDSTDFGSRCCQSQHICCTSTVFKASQNESCSVPVSPAVPCKLCSVAAAHAVCPSSLGPGWLLRHDVLLSYHRLPARCPTAGSSSSSTP